MTDRELLELAAKAAGLIPRDFIDNPNYMEGLLSHWNPLTDDGDALRLAVVLELHVLSGVAQDGEGRMSFGDSKDPYTDTRRAIVRSAAEIGRDLAKATGTNP